MSPRDLLFPVVLLSCTAACAGGTTPPETSPAFERGVVGGTVEMSVVPGTPVASVLVSVAGSTLAANVSRRTVLVPDGTPVRREASGGSLSELKPGMRVRVAGTLGSAGVTARELVIL